MQEVRLRQARRHRKTLRAVQGKASTILERPQEGRRRGRWRVTGGYRRREDEEEIKDRLQIHSQSATTFLALFSLDDALVFCRTFTTLSRSTIIILFILS